MSKYIHQRDNWADYKWQDAAVSASLGEVRLMQGRIMERVHSLGLPSKKERTLDALTSDVLNSFKIEGEDLDSDQVRSSVARRLGMDVAGLVHVSRYTDGIVEMMLDATQNYSDPLTEERLFGWHAALFPAGYSGMTRISVAKYRTEEMKIVSGAIGKEKVHYEAVTASDVTSEMRRFLSWFNDNGIIIDSILRSAIAHLWFISIHPFDDGNGRIARAISDMMLARSENSAERFYSLSEQFLSERSEYYDTLNKAQRGNGDITEWMIWFLDSLKKALMRTENGIRNVLRRSVFWEHHNDVRINERQRLMINKLFDGLTGKLTSMKWAKITKCSTDTALRDINDLIEKGILIKGEAGGRSAEYRFIEM